jgi:hypothetical protein
VAKAQGLGYILYGLISLRFKAKDYLAFCFILAVTWSCQDINRIKLKAHDNDLVITAIFTAKGTITQLNQRLAHEPSPVIRYDKNEALVSWVIHEDQLLDAKGNALSKTQIQALSVRDRVRAAPNGSCQKCTATSNGGAQIFHRGDACLIPANSESHLETENDDFGVEPNTLRASIVIDFPGDCECNDPPLAIAVPLRYRVHHSENEAWPFHSSAISQSGIAGLFSEVYVQTKHPDGQIYRKYKKDLPFEGPVEHANEVSDGFLVLSQFPAEDHTHDLFHLSWDLQTITRIWSNNTQRLFVDGIYPGLIEGQVLIRIENKNNYKPELLDCRRQSDKTLECQSALTDAAHARANQKITHITRDEEGRLVLLYRDGAFVIGQMEEDRLAWTFHDGPPRLQFEGAVFELKQASQIEYHQGRWVLCGAIENPVSKQEYIAVFTASVTTSKTEWSRIHTGGINCLGMFPKAQEPNTLQVLLTSTKTWELNETNEWRESDASLSESEGLDRPIQYGGQNRHGEVIFRGYDHSLFSRNTNTSSTSQRYGMGTHSPKNYHAMIPFDDHILAIRVDGQTASISSEEEIIKYQHITGLDSNESILDARKSSFDQSVLMTINGETSRVLRLNPETMQAKEVYRDPENVKRQLTEIVDTASGDIIAASSRGELLHIHDNKADLISINWDDPQTSTIEVAPADLSACFHDGTNHGTFYWPRPSEGSWQSLDEAQGVVWASGCEGLLLRIVVAGGDISTRRFTLNIDAETSYFMFEELPALSALRTVCGHQILVGSRGNVNHYTGRVWQLETQSTGIEFEHTQLARLAEYELLDTGVERAYDYDAGFPVALLGPNAYFRQVFTNRPRNTSTVGDLSGQHWFRLRAAATAAGQIKNDLVVIGANEGRLLIGRPEQ